MGVFNNAHPSVTSAFLFEGKVERDNGGVQSRREMRARAVRATYATIMRHEIQSPPTLRLDVNERACVRSCTCSWKRPNDLCLVRGHHSETCEYYVPRFLKSSSQIARPTRLHIELIFAAAVIGIAYGYYEKISFIAISYIRLFFCVFFYAIFSHKMALVKMVYIITTTFPI